MGNRITKCIGGAAVAIVLAGTAVSSANAALVRAEFTGVVDGSYLNAGAFGGQVNAGDPYRISFVIDTNTPVSPVADGVGYRRATAASPTEFTFQAGAFVRTETVTVIVGLAPGALDQFYIGFYDAAPILGDPVASALAGGYAIGMFPDASNPTVANLVDNASMIRGTGTSTYNGTALYFGGGAPAVFYTTDQARSFTVVPEPAFIGLIGIAAPALLMRRKR